MADSITTQDLANLLKAKKPLTLLDVRRKSDFEQASQKITGARWHDPEAIRDWVDTVPRDQAVVVYCVKGGSVSQSVAAELKQQACRVKYLDGGINAWRESGGAIE